ncbi:hypothetical protein D8674_016711 [Pyrus ussuriensis x Pyrus communis]|uniref:RRM domain-containing protein n=1 Tax=Pyrus ussuriensis x Pyrus communis TaxID=2448454 RepID=A0A5N5HFS6_9ROSA|nr:hypothetical protein D8674_016711 [Pyrus ussuriensis x Pyrus communis]
MATQDLTVQVLNLAPRVTLAELNTFFSYYQLPYALVTFVQPYAFQTALLLDDATFGGQQIGILPAYDIRIPIVSDEDTKDEDTKDEDTKDEETKDDHTQTKNQLGSIPTANMLKKSTEEKKEKLKLSEKARIVLMNQTKSAIYASEQATGCMGTALMNNNYVSTGVTGFSDVLDKASGSTSEFGIRKIEN